MSSLITRLLRRKHDTQRAAASPPTPEQDSHHALRVLLAERCSGDSLAEDSAVAPFLEALHARFGASLAAVLVYGSYLRGTRDTVLDFYALLDDYRPMPWWQALLCRLLAPNVYHVAAGNKLAKCATLRLDRFESAMQRDFHSYFWARFAQPCKLAYCRDDITRQRVLAALADAASTFIRRAVPMLATPLSTRALWVGGLNLTYRCELRAEKSGYSDGLVDADLVYYQQLTSLIDNAGLRPVANSNATLWQHHTSTRTRRCAAIAWRLRRWQGKVLSVARVAKAATMFDAPMDYILWKIERHSGHNVTLNPRQRRFPLVFAWPVLWRLYRRGAFR